MQLSGPIVPVGGGGMHPEIIETIKQMIGKPSYSVLILPQAGGTEDRGVAGVAMWEEAGAGRRAHTQCSCVFTAARWEVYRPVLTGCLWLRMR
jgi:hypothetical protein